MGRFVTIEGIDASGKSTLVTGLVDRLRERGVRATSVSKKQTSGYSDPFVDRLMTHLRAMLWDATPEDPVGMLSEFNWTLMHTLWYEVMQEHLLTPLLAEHDVVVSDGWCYKFLARHRVHAPEQATRTQVVMQTVRQADLVLFLDVSPEECWSRRTEFRPSELGAHGHVEGASARDKFIAYQRRVYSEFRAMAATTDFWRIIPAAQKTPEDLIASMVEEVLRVP